MYPLVLTLVEMKEKKVIILYLAVPKHAWKVSWKWAQKLGGFDSLVVGGYFQEGTSNFLC